MIQVAAVALLVLPAAVAAHAQARGADPELDNVARDAYASVEKSIRIEYDNAMAGLARDAAVRPPNEIDSAKEMLKFISYNKAVIFAYCFAETKRDHPPRNSRVRSESNIILTTCVESKFADLRRYTGVRPYVVTFFPKRVVPCELQSRLDGREKQLQPYKFLALDQPRLFDFAEINRCMMAVK